MTNLTRKLPNVNNIENLVPTDDFASVARLPAAFRVKHGLIQHHKFSVLNRSNDSFTLFEITVL
jgi:hypothetical protein